MGTKQDKSSRFSFHCFTSKWKVSRCTFTFVINKRVLWQACFSAVLLGMWLERNSRSVGGGEV